MNIEQNNPACDCGPCPCQQETIVLMAGLDDNFNTTTPDPPPDPAQDIENAFGPTSGFDAFNNDRDFLHTFRDLIRGNCSIVEAVLTIRLRATGFIPNTDFIQLGYGYNDGTQVRWIWGMSLNDLDEPGNWDIGDEYTAVFDLGSLQSTIPGLSITVLDWINMEGELDIRVSDDTMVDFVRLEYVTCCCLCPTQNVTVTTTVTTTVFNTTTVTNTTTITLTETLTETITETTTMNQTVTETITIRVPVNVTVTETTTTTQVSTTTETTTTTETLTTTTTVTLTTLPPCPVCEILNFLEIKLDILIGLVSLILILILWRLWFRIPRLG